MSVLSALTSGGPVMVKGTLQGTERAYVNNALRSFSKKLAEHALALKVPAAKLAIRQATYLLVIRDSVEYHFVFAAAPGTDQLVYRDVSSSGRLDRASVLSQVRLSIGEPIWSFPIPAETPDADLQRHLDQIVRRYVGSILRAEQDAGKEITQVAVSPPEIASGLERFKQDHAGKKTAFIMMQFAETGTHTEIVRVVKETLDKHSIDGLRADDKHYMDDLFPNVKVYMHACDFGIAVIERIEEDDANPNVSLEVGYMLGLGKDVLLLKDRTLKTLQTDLAGRLYRKFNTRAVAATAPAEIEKWLSEKGL